MRVAMLGASLLAVASPRAARAEDGPICTWSMGWAGNLAPAGRDWSLTTPGAVAWSMTPVVAQQCTRHEDDQPLRGWFGVDLVPTLRHSYARLGVRAPLLVLFHAGLDLRLGPYSPHFAGLQLVTNSNAWGLGARLALWQRGPRRQVGLHGLELQLGWLSGEDPDFFAMATVRTHARLVGEASLDDFGTHRHPVGLETGFEVGPVTGFRFQLRLGDYSAPQIGVRAGLFTNLFARAALQPIGLGTFDLPLGEGIDLEVSGGATLRDARVGPIGGVAFQVDNDTAINLQIGALVGWDGERVYGSIDGGPSWVW